jgi:hypothetical protein
MIEVECLAVGEEAAALAGASWPAARTAAVPCPVSAALFVAIFLCPVAVPLVCVVHVGTGGEDAALAAQNHDLDCVVVRQLL